MAKSKVAAETRDKTDTKKPKQIPRGKAGGTRGKVKKDPGKLACLSSRCKTTWRRAYPSRQFDVK